MKCAKVTTRLAGYLDDALAGAPSPEERRQIGVHLDSCADCREELQRYRKLAVLLSRMPRAVPPADLALRIKIAAAKEQETAIGVTAGSTSKIAPKSCLIIHFAPSPFRPPAASSPPSSFLLSSCT